MTDWTRDELLDHAQDFDLAPNRSEQERASDTALSAHGPGTRNPSGSVRHNFKTSPNPRTRTCAACGRIKTDPVHQPKLRKAAIVAALNLACKHTREDEGDMALIQVGVAARLLRGDDT